MRNTPDEDKTVRVLRFLALTLILTSATGQWVEGESRHPLTIANLISFDRLSDPQISPDGKYIAYRAQSRPGYDRRHCNR